MKDFLNVNNFLNSLEESDQVKEVEVVMNDPDVVKNILLNEIVKVNRLESVTSELLNYITDSKAIKNLTYKEKQSLLRNIIEIQTNSRDFIFRAAELANKNEFLKKIMEVSYKPNQVIQSCNGESYISSIDDETRRDLTELLRDVINERCRNNEI